MVRYIGLFILAGIISACCKQEELSIEKTPFQGGFRIDGYYISIDSSVANSTLTDIEIFYHNGVMLDYYEYRDLEIIEIENELISDNSIDFFKRSRDGYGVFQLVDSIIRYEHWTVQDGLNKCYPVFTGIGEILNDTTLLLFGDQVYHFRQFSPKPDSTNMWIE